MGGESDLEDSIFVHFAGDFYSQATAQSISYMTPLGGARAIV